MSNTHLALTVRIAQSLVQPGAKAAVVYRRWGGTPAMWEVAATPIAASGELVLEVPPPEALAWTTLPPALGGPFPFAIGYILVRVMPADVPAGAAPVVAPEPAADAPDDADADEVADDGPRVLAVAPLHRVLWMSGPFPSEAFAKLAEDPRLTDDEKQAIARDLGALPTGLSLARTAKPSRSLVGYAVVDGEVVDLDPERSLSWPPSVF